MPGSGASPCSCRSTGCTTSPDALHVLPTQYPHFFYGFMSVAMAWQIAFLVIGLSPARFRPFMIPAILEKLGYVGTLVVLLIPRAHLGGGHAGGGAGFAPGDPVRGGIREYPWRRAGPAHTDGVGERHTTS